MRFDLYARSSDAWDAMLAAINSAKRSVYLEMYIFLDDTQATHDFVGAFERKAKEGVRVVLLLDAYGSYGISRAAVNRLEAAGVEVRFFKLWFHRTHRKLLIVDEEVAFVGGVNVAKRFADWIDLQVSVRGKSVRPLLRSFVRAYRLSGGQSKLPVPSGIEKEGRYPLRAWLLEHVPAARQFSLRKYYVRKLWRAKTSVELITPYYVPSPWFERSLLEACRRGVKVTIVVPQRTNYQLLDVANRHYGARAADMGVDVRLASVMNHAKAVLIDRSEAMVGSANLDSLSFDRNSEIGLFFVEPDAVAKVAAVVDEWIGKSDTLTEATRLAWYERPLVPLVRLFHSVL